VYGQQKGRFNGPWGCEADTEGAIKDCDVIYTDGPWALGTSGYLGTSEAIGDLE
jgi:hypothetical protein